VAVFLTNKDLYIADASDNLPLAAMSLKVETSAFSPHAQQLGQSKQPVNVDLWHSLRPIGRGGNLQTSVSYRLY